MDDIYRMGSDAWSEGLPVEQYLEECRSSAKYKRGEWYVLSNGDGALVSALIVYRMGDDAGLGSLATPPELRGQGYASALLKGVLKFLDQEKVERVFLFSDIDPEFYVRFGFRALPSELQLEPGSVCMLRGDLDSFLAREIVEVPKYF